MELCPTAQELNYPINIWSQLPPSQSSVTTYLRSNSPKGLSVLHLHSLLTQGSTLLQLSKHSEKLVSSTNLRKQNTAEAATAATLETALMRAMNPVRLQATGTVLGKPGCDSHAAAWGVGIIPEKKTNHKASAIRLARGLHQVKLAA